jgi:hypothetical protein
VAPPTHAFVLVLQTQPDFKPAQLSPQSMARPQPSPTLPQYLAPAAGSQVVGTQTSAPPTHTFFSHDQPVFRLAQLSLQVRGCPQPSEMSPQ